MTYNVLMWMLNLTHSVTHSLTHSLIHSVLVELQAVSHVSHWCSQEGRVDWTG